ncbi:hypothetical protein CFK37_08545 [Virgibacillus phasianinus]|uniref:exo-alpha-sialidase n=1 Tax=Virgibacillus phasianinus TaxID=2017483 RepID=A0A220U2D8_9BACI|nr:NPCBM/NEW2 domain-containing protein [Virgibacillus phasianinus]ASK62205.1 hypothetical protein CFK37_08545 [Virgibacillus phasianinus]
MGASLGHPVQAANDLVLDYSLDRSFDGSSDYVDQTNDLEKVKGLSQGSMLVTFKTTSTKVANTFISAADTQDPSSNLSFTMNNGGIYFENRENGAYATRLTASGSFNDGNWHTAVLTVGSSGTKIYVDGREMGSSESTAFFSNVTDPDGMWIGKNVDNTGGQWYYNGRIDKLQVYNKALSAEEVRALSDGATNGFFKEKELFNINDGKGYAQYRIPSISVTANGTILAVAEARTGGDQTPTDLVLRRSTDGGETFSEQVILAPGVANGHAEMNPMLLAEDTGSTVHLLWSRWEWGNCKYFIRTSTDNGATWGETRNITDVLDAYTDPESPDYFPNLSAAGMGPGHGLQMSNGALVVPIYLTTEGWSNSTVAYIYSTDGGTTWQAGPKVPNPGGYTKIHENMMVELSDGGLMANMRNPGSDYRAVSTTAGLNEPWSTPVSDTKLIDPVNEASLATYDENTILFTNTANTSARTNMTIRMSDDDGQTWFASKEIYAGMTGYSDVYVGPEKTINTLYEKPAGSKIVLAQFNKDWILGAANIRLQTSKQIESGETSTVKATFTNHSEKVEKDVEVNLEHPENWAIEASQPVTFDEVKPGESVEVTWNVTPDETVEAGTYDLTAVASFTLNGNQTSATASKKIQVLPKVPTETSYLSDLGWISALNGWGPVERDLSVGENDAGDGNVLTINGETYEKGLGVHAYSEIRYHIGGNFSRFKAEIGVDDEVAPSSAASVVFQVFGDGEKLFDSGLMTGEDEAKNVDISIEDVNELKLIVTDGGNGNGSDHADWANAKVIVAKEDISAATMKAMVKEFAEEGEFVNDRAAHSLDIHLTAVDRYEDQGLGDKVVKHLEGFAQLLDYQKENELISKRAYESLQEDMEYLVEKYQ